MDIIGHLRRLESNLARRIDEAAHRVTPSDAREPLEILHAIVDLVETRIEPAGRGTYVFPFDRIHVRIAADSSETQARFDAVLGAKPTLHDRVVERLDASGCESAGLGITTGYIETAGPQWTTPHFDIQFERVAGLPSAAGAAAAPAETLKLRVTRGVSENSDYAFTASRINLGRCLEVRDSRNRLIRTNHVVFVENGAEPNQSVSRSHAHISRSEAPGDVRLYDDQSAHGTSIIRCGQTIDVRPGGRGVRLQAGDDIVLGEACLHVEFETAPQSDNTGTKRP